MRRSREELRGIPGSLQESEVAGERTPVLSAVHVGSPATVGSLRLTYTFSSVGPDCSPRAITDYLDTALCSA